MQQEQQKKQAYENLLNAYKEMSLLSEKEQVIDKQLKESIIKQDNLLEAHERELDLYEQLESEKNKIENMQSQIEKVILKHGKLLIPKEINESSENYDDRIENLLVLDSVEMTSKFVEQIGANIYKNFDQTEKNEHEYFKTLDKNLTNEQKKVHGIRISKDNSRNYDSQIVDQNRYCLTYKEVTGSVEDPINYEPIKSKDMIIRVVTIDGRHTPKYQCYDIKNLYDWVIVRGNKTNPVAGDDFSMVGTFDEESINQIKKKYENLQKSQKL